MENANTVMGTMEHHITVFGPQQHYIITTTPTTSHPDPDNLNLVVSPLLSAWVPMSKVVYRLNSPEIPSRRRSANELPVLQSTNNQN